VLCVPPFTRERRAPALEIETVMRTLKASLVGSAVGTGAWLLGLTNLMWPAHPQLAVFFLTIAATLVLMNVLPEPQSKRK